MELEEFVQWGALQVSRRPLLESVRDRAESGFVVKVTGEGGGDGALRFGPLSHLPGEDDGWMPRQVGVQDVVAVEQDIYLLHQGLHFEHQFAAHPHQFEIIYG